MLSHRADACKPVDLRVASRSDAKRVPHRAANALKGLLESTASVHSLSPVTSSAQDDSTSELLRFL
jgi:hypothetical protein